MLEIIIPASVAVGLASVAGAYKIGHSIGRKNGNNKIDTSNLVDDETCNLRRQVDRLEVCRKLDRVMIHLGIDPEDSK